MELALTENRILLTEDKDSVGSYSQADCIRRV